MSDCPEPPSAEEPDGQATAAEPLLPEAAEQPASVAIATPVSRWWPVIAGITLLVFAGFFAAEPAVRWLREVASGRSAVRVSQPAALAFTLEYRTLEALTCAWFFMLGASFGSFLHCVEYRLPRRISVVARGSSCPGCGKAIHLWHNVPVFGWLWLRAHCAACKWPIPFRYALTELVFGIVFVLLMVVELMGAGMNIPFLHSGGPLGVMENVWNPNWRLIGLYAYHVSLLTFLLTACLFAWDRFRLPLKILAFALVAGAAVPLVWPAFQAVDWYGSSPVLSSVTAARFHVALGLALGSLMGLFLGGCLARRTPGNMRSGDAAATILGMLWVGLYLGWQAALAVAAITILLRLLASPTRARSWPVVASITAATLVHLLGWSWLIQQPFYPGLAAHWWVVVAEFLIVAVAGPLVDSIEFGGDAGPPLLVLPTAAKAEALPASASSSEPRPHNTTC